MIKQKYCLQAIETKFLAPTNFKGQRIVAKCFAKRIVYNWNYELDVFENHRDAALKLQKLLNRKGELIGGCLPSGNYCFVVKGERS
ncbi:MAG TPA: hypothetical protein PLN79_12075 [bacterium]|nr:hypothetical protein [bacterium]